jgi:hypothetical protein
MSYGLQLQSPPNFENLIKNGIKIEENLVKRGVLKIHNDNNPSNSSNNDKPNFWHKYKNNNHDSPNEMHNVKPIFKLFRSTSKNNGTTNKNIAN